jgi:hypothetical protein
VRGLRLLSVRLVIDSEQVRLGTEGSAVANGIDTATRRHVGTTRRQLVRSEPPSITAPLSPGIVDLVESLRSDEQQPVRIVAWLIGEVSRKVRPRCCLTRRGGAPRQAAGMRPTDVTVSACGCVTVDCSVNATN